MLNLNYFFILFHFIIIYKIDLNLQIGLYTEQNYKRNTFVFETRSLKTCDICGIVLCDKTTHFRVVFYCGQPKTHLCNNHAV